MSNFQSFFFQFSQSRIQLIPQHLLNKKEIPSPFLVTTSLYTKVINDPAASSPLPEKRSINRRPAATHAGPLNSTLTRALLG